MFVAKVEKNNDILTLTGREKDWQVLGITGLNPAPAQINTTTIAGMDGSRFNSARLNNKNIVLQIRLNGNVEANRQLLYSYFITKELCSFYFKNENRDVKIDGYVESVECDLFTIGEVMQVSIDCMSPFFESVRQQIREISAILGAFHFPFAINVGEPIPFSEIVEGRMTNVQNVTDTATGVVIKIDLAAATQTITIRNETYDETLTIAGDFLAGDEIIINTNPGQKRATLLRDGTAYNVFGSIQQGSAFFVLRPGNNIFSYAADGGAQDLTTKITLLFTDKYRGV